MRDVSVPHDLAAFRPSQTSGPAVARVPDASPAPPPTPKGAALEEKARALLVNQESYDLLQGATRPVVGGNEKGSARATAHTVANPKSQFVATVQKNFTRWDANNNGTLENTEIDKAMTNPKIKGRDAAALAGLESLEDGPDFKGFGAKDLKRIERAHRKGDTAFDSLMTYYEQHIGRYTSQRTLFGKDGLPHIEDIAQGAQGDCYFLSSLGSKVQRDPQAVKDMIKPNADGTYTVSFADGDVTLKMPTDAQAARSSNGEHGRWVPLMEKAYAIHIRDKTPGADRDPYESIGRGGVIEEAMRTLGSPNPVGYPLDPKNPSQQSDLGDVRSALTTQINDNKWLNAIVLASPLGLPTGHAYTIEGYDAAGDRVTVRNPWGTVGATKPGVIEDLGKGAFSLSMDDFLKNFSHIVVG